MEGEHSDGNGRGQKRGRGRGRGRGQRGGFTGSLTNLPQAPAGEDRSAGKGKGKERESGAAVAGVAAVAVPPSAATVASSAVAETEADLCFICTEPVQLYSLSPCNHRTCHVCSIRLRALYKKKECTFCKVSMGRDLAQQSRSRSSRLPIVAPQASSDVLIFTKNGNKDFLSFSAEDIPFKDEKLNIYFEDETSREDTLILLRFNCPDPLCEYVASSWADLRLHARAEHERFLCDLCIKHSRVFVHEHKLFTSPELSRHIQADHKYCDFCKLNFYSSDELYVHMRDRHEQCFLCKKSEDRQDEYQRDYRMLERHFKSEHFLCESKDCLEKKFVVFESEMDFKAHQVAEHGAELSSREKRDALRVTANFRFDASSSSARGGGGAAPGSSGLTARGRPKKDEEPETKRDVLGISMLASRSHVPGAGGAADHQSRRAQFGGALTASTPTNRGKGKGKVTPGESSEDEAARRAVAEKVQRHQRYMDQVHAILVHSDAKMQSFRANVKVYRAGEMSSKDLVHSIYSLVGDMGQVETIIVGLVDLVEEADKRVDILEAWNTLRLERTQFPSLAPTFLDSSKASSVAKGQIRNAKASSAANSNTRIWENVERAAASGRGYGTASTRTAAKEHFPSLAAKPGTPSVPGSARHSAAANASVRSTAWAGSTSHAHPEQKHSPSAGSSSPVPYSVEVIRDPQRSNQTSIRSHPSAFPTLPTSASAANLAAYKRSLFDSRQGSRGDNTPTKPVWGSSLGRIDGSSDDVDAELLHHKLGEARIQEQQRKKSKQKNVLVTLGSTRRGG